jgi:hypothetical protein
MTNRIGGDWSVDALEAFRSAYAAQLMAPEEMDTDKTSGLPTSNISNTAPWHGFVPTWKYPSGKGPDDDLKKPFNPEAFLPDGDDDDEITDEEIERYLSTLSDEELDELLSEVDEEEYDEEISEEVGAMSDDEIDNLIDEIFADEGEEQG